MLTWIIFFFLFAVIIKSYKNVLTKLKDCIDQNFAFRFIKNETISFL